MRPMAEAQAAAIDELAAGPKPGGGFKEGALCPWDSLPVSTVPIQPGNRSLALSFKPPTRDAAMMPPDYRLALTECGIWLRRSIPRNKVYCLIAAHIDLHTSFMISAGINQNAELAKMRAMGNITDMYFSEKAKN